MRAKNLEDVLVYQKAMNATDAVFPVLERPAVRNDFDIWDQLRRSSGSVGPLIAEGFGQVTDRHFAAYLGRARGSAYETCAQLDRAYQEIYLSNGTPTADRAVYRDREDADTLDQLPLSLRLERSWPAAKRRIRNLGSIRG
jgi:four helix bundle protein